MSNYWDLYCRDCKSNCGFHWNHGEESLKKVWNGSKAFIRGLTSIQEMGIDLEVRFVGPETHPHFSTFYEWVEFHRDHIVVIKSEYGYYYDV